MTMLSDFLNEHGIKPEQVVAESKALEAHHISQRGLRLKRTHARVAKKTYAEMNLEKPKTLGRGVSETTVKRALVGTPMPRLARKKIARAINALLVSKKAEPVDARKLFNDVKSKKGPKKK